MNKKSLINNFRSWLMNNSIINLMHSYDFAKSEINKMLETEAPGRTVFEDENIFVGSYEYEFIIGKADSSDKKAHTFSFSAIGIGSKENVTENDYELADYRDHTFIINK